MAYKKKDGIEKRKKFYNEREWRYIPVGSSVEVFFDKAESEICKAIQNKERMKLDLNQVEYIIIERESDFPKMIEELKKIGKKRKIAFENLVAKIMTAKQIEKDF